ncbi:MAG: hypothetical protein K6G09_07745 [Treponema sp.]|nr:hypothetical protein [Treponema sp.]
MQKIITNIKSTVQSAIQSVSEGKVKWIELDKIKIDSEFKNVFPQKESDVQKIKESMLQNNGFDPLFPIIVTKNVAGVPDFTTVDGHSRLEAVKAIVLAGQAEISKIPYIEKHFENRSEIISFIYRTQMARRNLTEQELYSYYVRLSSQTDENGKQLKTDTSIASELDISRRQLAKYKEVASKSSPKVLNDFKSGNLSLNKAYTIMKAEESGHKHLKKTVKTKKKSFDDGYTAGIRYAVDAISKGKTPEEVLSELQK